MIKKILHSLFHFFNNYRLPILSGILIGTSNVPFPPWATLFYFVPLWIFWIKETSLKKIFLGGLLTQFFFSLIGFSWLVQTLQKFGGIPFLPAFIGFLLFCSLFHIYIPLVGLIWGWIRRKTKANPLKSPFLWFFFPPLTALGEMIIPPLFPWNHAYTWAWVDFPIIQLGDLIGFQGISILCLFYNLLSLFIWKKRSHKRKAALLLTLAVVSFAYFNYLGWSRQERLPHLDSQAKVLLVQAGIGGTERRTFGRLYKSHTLNKYIELTNEALEHFSNFSLDFIVWPEVAFPDVLSSISRKQERGWRGREIQKRYKKEGQKESKTPSYFSYPEQREALTLRSFVKKNQIALITGAWGKESFSGPFANAFFLIGPKGENDDTPYFKTHLLAFGEYLPGSHWFPSLKKLFPQVGNLLQGNGPHVKKLKRFKIGPQICYESLFSDFTRKLSQQGAQFIVNLTNDSWYDNWQEPYQHFYLALARAIEFRRPLIRSTNTGISSVILANGEILEQSPLNKKWWHVYNIPYSKEPKPTFYQKYGDLVPLLLFLFISLLFFMLFFNVSLKKEDKEQKPEEKGSVKKPSKGKNQNDKGQENQVKIEKKNQKEIKQDSKNEETTRKDKDVEKKDTESEKKSKNEDKKEENVKEKVQEPAQEPAQKKVEGEKNEKNSL